MNHRLPGRFGKAPLIGEVLCAMLTFPLTFAFMEHWAQDANSADLSHWVCALYAVLALARLFRALRLRGGSRALFAVNLVCGVALAFGAALVEILGYSDASRNALSMIFWACLLADRALALIRRRTLQSILLNGVAILLILLLAFSTTLGYGLIFVMAAATLQALVSILAVTFSSIRLDVLKDIVRKTYAGEIIFGLLLTMVAFSYVLKFFDEAFTSFWDGLWYCFAVVTTIGFGDLTPTTAVGRVITVILGAYGIVVVALITSVIVNFYGEMKRADAGEGVKGDDPA